MESLFFIKQKSLNKQNKAAPFGKFVKVERFDCEDKMS